MKQKQKITDRNQEDEQMVCEMVASEKIASHFTR